MCNRPSPPRLGYHLADRGCRLSTVLWIVLVGGALIAGATVVLALVAVRSREPFAAIIGVIGFAGSAWAFGRLGSVYASVDALVYAFGLAVGALGGGYALASALLDRLSRPVRLLPVETGSDTGCVRVLLFACAEPEEYEPRVTSRELGRLSDEGLVDLTIGVTPFMYAAQKARYSAIGGTSPARGQVRQLAEAMESALREKPFERVDEAWCEGSDSLASRVIDAARAGCRHVVVAVAAVAESAEMATAKRSVDRLRLADRGITVSYTRPLWNSEPIISILSARIMAAVDDPASTGVALIAHGQPEVREQTYASFDADESGFVNRIRMMLTDHGIEEVRIRIAWAEWRDPDVASTVRHLAALGCTRVVVVPACFPFDDLMTRLDVPVGVRQARTDKSVSVITLNAWSDDPAIGEALARAVRETYEETAAKPPAPDSEGAS